MNNALPRRVWALIALGIVALTIFVLAASLSGVRLLPGHPFAIGGEPTESSRELSGVPPLNLTPLWKIFMAIVLWVLFPLSIVYFLISAEARRRVLRDLVWVLATLVLVLLLMRAFTKRREALEQIRPPAEGDPVVPPEFILRPGEFITHPPGWFVFVISALVLIVVVGGLALLWRRLKDAPGEALDRLAEEAQAALDELRAGGDFRNAVLRCYHEMGRILGEERGVRRAKAMTPREFEERLEASGVRDEHVRQLTQLFERTRYGPEAPGPREEREAEACLRAIVEAYGRSP